MAVGLGLANLLLSLGDTVAQMFGYKMKVTVDQHEINVEFVEESKINVIGYDPDHYVNGNIFLKGKANPVKPVLDEAENEVELMSSERYRDYMKNNLAREMIKSAEGDQGTDKMVLLAVMFSAGTMFMMLGLLAMMVM